MLQSENIRQYYNTLVREEQNYEYEHDRWFKTPIRKAGFAMTRATIERLIKGIQFDSYFEVGSGPGTWTKLFIEKNPDARFTLLDISVEMLVAAKKQLADIKQIEYIERDFAHFQPDRTVDVFFSSRALEYMSDKKAVIKNIGALLNPGGTGIIITKFPKYFRAKLRGREMVGMHEGQIHPKTLAKLLQHEQCTNIRAYPVIMNMPFLESPSLSLQLYKWLGTSMLNPVNSFFAESYIITFTKQ